jgi:hypothetical protein
MATIKMTGTSLTTRDLVLQELREEGGLLTLATLKKAITMVCFVLPFFLLAISFIYA